MNDPTAKASGARRLSESAHPRTFRQNRFVYPVLSRRSGGVSIGINLNPDKACNFDCLYCQVDRSRKPLERFVEQRALEAELRSVLEGLKEDGTFWTEPEFSALPAAKRRVTDLAFSGDGEPTTFRNFFEVARQVAGIKEELGFKLAKVVLITNATGLDRPDIKKTLRFLDAHRGEVWAKLEAGREAYYRLIANTSFPFKKILANILACARERSIVIQSCFMRVRGEPPAEAELDAFVERLRELCASGAHIHLVQIYTVARAPAFGMVSSLAREEVDRITRKVIEKTSLEAKAFYGEVPEGRGLMGAEPAGRRINQPLAP